MTLAEEMVVLSRAGAWVRFWVVLGRVHVLAAQLGEDAWRLESLLHAFEGLALELAELGHWEARVTAQLPRAA